MRLYISCCLLLISLFATSQSRFPSDFIGHWEGKLDWYSAGKPQPQTVKVQLIVRPTDSAGVYTWQIIYGDAGQDNRPYRLRAIDTAKGHWRIDEGNGIVFEQWWLGNRFTAAFTVGNSTIMDSYWREGDALIMEFYSISAKPVATTGKDTDDSRTVNSYATKSYQRARLIRRT